MRTRHILLSLVLTILVTQSGRAAVASKAPDDGKLRIIVFGAHPDDCELDAGGCAILWAAQGHHVKFVSTTNGDIGHSKMAGGPLAKRRTAEVKAAAKILGVEESQVLDIHDGELMPTLENRKKIVRLIRDWNADIVISHRPNDYHPDHRYTGILVQDAAFMVTVTHFCPDVEALTKNPVFLYSADGFQKPNPFEADIVVGIDEVVERKMDAIWKLESQIESTWATGGFERVIPIPKSGPEREKRRKDFIEGRLRRARVPARYRKKLLEFYGREKADKIKYVEAFEICEYGRRPSEEDIRKLFPFFD
ncbi:MAG: PIG-L family deacetylase [Phycisphaerales bacterium]|nr:MAG: PIG-L family deacetylase [Phycisphaerales bacterium]